MDGSLIFVTGATGTLGSEVVRQLVEPVTECGRWSRTAPTRTPSPPGVDVRIGDLADPAPVVEALELSRCQV
jgi:uncharacterized protein YbjT (DUF2867 family)